MAARSAKKRVRKPVQRRSAATVATILEAAAQIFRQHGVTGATTNRIAERAGVSIGSLYQYFPNKGALLSTLMEQHITESIHALGDVLRQTEGASPETQIRAAVTCVLDIHMEDPELHRILFEEAPRPPQVNQRLEQGATLMRVRLEQVLAGFPRETCPDPKRSAYMALMLVEGMVHRYVAVPDRPMEPTDFADHLTQMVMGEMRLPIPSAPAP